jgi:hypothetical protein
MLDQEMKERDLAHIQFISIQDFIIKGTTVTLSTRLNRWSIDKGL